VYNLLLDTFSHPLSRNIDFVHSFIICVTTFFHIWTDFFYIIAHPIEFNLDVYIIWSSHKLVTKRLDVCLLLNQLFIYCVFMTLAVYLSCLHLTNCLSWLHLSNCLFILIINKFSVSLLVSCIMVINLFSSQTSVSFNKSKEPKQRILLKCVQENNKSQGENKLLSPRVTAKTKTKAKLTWTPQQLNEKNKSVGVTTVSSGVLTDGKTSVTSSAVTSNIQVIQLQRQSASKLYTWF